MDGVKSKCRRKNVKWNGKCRRKNGDENYVRNKYEVYVKNSLKIWEIVRIYKQVFEIWGSCIEYF